MRNNEIFSSLPELEISRSRFDRDSNLHTTLNSGMLYPIYLDEVLPGDTFDMTCASTVRMTTPIVPVMDNCYLDTFFFFVPSRLCWNRWKEFCGEKPRDNWDSINEDLKLPHIAFTKACQWMWDSELQRYRPPTLDEQPNLNGGLFKNLQGTLVDYFGLPYLNMRDNRGNDTFNYSKTDTFNMLPFEAYNLIWNEFFRDENVMDKTPLYLQNTSENDSDSYSGIYYTTDQIIAGNESLGSFNNWNIENIIMEYLSVKPVSKFHDYFTSCLPQPQKHAPVALPGFDSVLKVYSDGSHDGNNLYGYQVPMSFAESNNPDSYGALRGSVSLGSFGDLSYSSDSSVSISGQLTPNNLWATFGSSAPNVNDLRYAFALQRLFEKDARGGTRYTELLTTHFGVTSPDARLQRPEYLGGDRMSINMEQVIQTSETSSTSPQGNVSGLSLTNNIGNSFVKSFTEHGYILGLACIRPQHSYQNGISRLWSRNERFDFYYPALANIGEQPVFLRELLAGVHSADSDVPTVFGYQEPWAEYRYKPNSVTGKMRSLLPDSLDIWHYADIFNNVDDDENDTIQGVPTLTAQFMCENPFNVDRSLAISFKEQPQFYGDFYFKCACTRPMPIFSIPGLIDHH